MKPMRFGLQARFLAAMALMLVVVIALLGTLLQAQRLVVAGENSRPRCAAASTRSLRSPTAAVMWPPDPAAPCPAA